MVTSHAITPLTATLVRGITNVAELGSTAQAQLVPTVLRDVLNIAKMTTSPILVRHLLIVTAFIVTDIVPDPVMSLAPVAGEALAVAPSYSDAVTVLMKQTHVMEVMEI